MFSLISCKRQTNWNRSKQRYRQFKKKKKITKESSYIVLSLSTPRVYVWLRAWVRLEPRRTSKSEPKIYIGTYISIAFSAPVCVATAHWIWFIKIALVLDIMSCSVSELQRSSCRLRGSSQGSGGGGATAAATHGASNMGGPLNRPQSHKPCCLCWCCCCSCSW